MNPDFLIIGGGIAGCSAALEFSRAGATVTLLERHRIGSESSWAGGGILSPLLPWDYREEVTRLTQWSNALYPEWVAALQAHSGIDPEYCVSGMLVLPPFDAATATKWCESHCMPLEPLPARRLAPALGLDAEALWLPQVAQLRNPRLIKALQRALELAGVQVLESSEVSDIRFEASRVAAISTRQTSFSAGNYVLAAGAWSGTLWGELTPVLPVTPVRGQMLLFRVAPGLLTQIILREGIYLIPRLDGHILVGSTLEQSGFDKSTTEAARHHLLDAAHSILPQLTESSLVGHWAGLRPGSPDNIPIIGRHPHIDNLYACTGHFRYGVTMAPASARLLVDLALDIPPSIDPLPYRWPGTLA